MMTTVTRLFVAGMLCAGALACEFPVTPAPDFPSGITAVPVSTSQVLVSWDAAPRAEQYRVRVSAASQSQGGTVYDKKTKTLSVRVDGLQPGQFYTVQVAAVNGTGTSVFNETSVAPYPVAPTGLSVRQLEGEGFHVAWPASRGATGYRLHRLIDGAEATLDTPFLELEDLGCSRGQKVAYRVEALPDPLGKQVFVEGRGACGVKRELCVLDGQSGVLRFEPGLSGDGAPSGEIAASGSAFQIDRDAGEVFVATPDGIQVHSLDGTRFEAPKRVLAVQNVLNLALSQTDRRLFVLQGSGLDAHLLAFDRGAAGDAAPMSDAPLSLQVTGAMLAWDDELFVAGIAFVDGTLQTVVSVFTLNGLFLRQLTTQTAQTASVTALAADPVRKQLLVGEANASLVKVFDREAQGLAAPARTVSVVGLPRGLVYDSRTDELFAIDQSSAVQVVDFSGAAQSVKLRSLSGPSTGLKAAMAIGFCE